MTDKAAGHYSAAIKILGIVCAVALIFSGWALLARFNQTNELRREQAHVWHAVVCTIEIQVLKNQDATAREQKRALRFYDGLLVDDVHAAPCHLVIKGEAK